MAPHHKTQILEQLLDMIRAGLPMPGSSAPLSVQIENALRFAKADPAITSNETARLRLITIEAEFLGQNGDYSAAAVLLRPEWMKLRNLVNPHTKVPARDATLLRQQVWLVLHFIHYGLYLGTGDIDGAIQLLAGVSVLIKTKLSRDNDKNYRPRGTLALLHYYLGCCFRSARRFREAEETFLEAKKNTLARTKDALQRKANDESAVRRELAVRDVFCARILAEQSWISIHRGRLLPAEHLLTTARMLLVSSVHESIERQIVSLQHIAIRRRVKHRDYEYEKAIRVLEECHSRFNARADIAGQFRSASEIVRGYLDRAEFNEDARDHDLMAAASWLKHARAAAVTDRDRVSVPLLAMRRAILLNDAQSAEKYFQEAKKVSSETGRDHQPDGNKKAPRPVGIVVMQVRLSILRKQYAEAIRTAADALKQNTSRENRVPVVESELLLLLADCHLHLGDVQLAKAQLDRWNTLAQFVEHHYLHQYAIELRERARRDDFVTPYNFESESRSGKGTLRYLMDSYEEWIISNAIQRFGGESNGRIAQWLGVGQSTLERRIKRYKLDAAKMTGKLP